MSSVHEHIEELFQQTDSAALTLRAVPVVPDTYRRSVQLVERQSAEMAQTLSRVRSQLECLAHDVERSSVNADVAKQLFKLSLSRYTYSSGLGSAILPLSTLRQFLSNLVSSRISEDERANHATYEQHLYDANLSTMDTLLRVQAELFKIRLDKLATDLSDGSDSVL